MADDLGLLDDTPQATPLDLLINAIAGSGQYHFAPEDGGDGVGDVVDVDGADAAATAEQDAAIAVYLGTADAAANGSDTVVARKRPAEATYGRLAKVSRTLNSHFARRPGASNAFSTIEVWHPETGQKSYGKERR
jgi:hypothetical protein